MSTSLPLSPPPAKLPSNFYQEFLDDDKNFEEYSSPLTMSFKSATIQLAQAGLLKLGALAFVHPFESLKLLRQVQYGTAVDMKETGGFFESNEYSDKFKVGGASFADSSTSNDADDEGDCLSQRRSSRTFFDHEAEQVDDYLNSSDISKLSNSLLKVPGRVDSADIDSSGYVKSSSSVDSPTTNRPLIFNKNASIWASFMLAAKYQGIPSLWNGIFAFWAYQNAHEISTIVFEEVLTSQYIWNRPGGVLGFNYLAPTTLDASNPLQTFPVIPVAGSIVLNGAVNFLLTPIDLVRTRLVAQSIYPSELKCNGIVSAISSLYREEGGISALYPQAIFNGISSLILPTIRILPLSIFNHFSEAWIESLGIPSGFTYAIMQFVFSCTNLAISLPIETIKRRLFLQSRKKISQRWIYRVPVSPIPYNGFWNCLRRICQEEGASALYQGWSMQLASNTVLLASNFILEMENEFPDDMEAF